MVIIIQTGDNKVSEQTRRAAFSTGGKQYWGAEGDIITVERRPEEAGSEIDLGPAMMLIDGEKVEIGTPSLTIKVTAKVLTHKRGKKINVIKFKRRKKYRRKQGHRQDLTVLQIEKIA